MKGNNNGCKTTNQERGSKMGVTDNIKRHSTAFRKNMQRYNENKTNTIAHNRKRILRKIRKSLVLFQNILC